MRSIILILLLLPGIFSACENAQEYACEAVVMEKVNSSTVTCSEVIYLLKFTRGLDKVQEAIGEGYQLSDSLCSALNLPLSLRTEGLSVLLDIRALEDDEPVSCYNLEMPLSLGPTVFVTRAERK